MARVPKQVRDLFESEQFDCWKTANICGEERCKKQDGSFLPPPYTYVGEDYANSVFEGKRVPRILAIGINQGKGNSKDGIYSINDEQARNSIYDFGKDKKGRFTSDGFGPRCLAANLGHIAYSCVPGINGKEITPGSVHRLMAWTNFVKCTSTLAAGKPTDEMWKNCREFTIKEVETIEPDLIFCIGRKVFDNLWEAFHESRWTILFRPEDTWNYSYAAKKDNNVIGVGMFFHYSSQIMQNVRWKLIQDKKAKKVGKRNRIFVMLDEILGGEPRDYEKAIEEKAELNEWWGERHYTYGYQTNPFSACLALAVIERLVDEWQSLSSLNRMELL